MPPRRRRRGAWDAGRNWLAALGLLAAPVALAAEEAPPPAFTFAAAVDQSTVQTGQTLTLTLTLGGELRGVELPAYTLPEGFEVTARSQGTSLAVRGGTMERTMTLTYVLRPQRAGVFTLGPFSVERNGVTVSTEPLTVTVEPSSLAPSAPPPGGRITL